MFCQHEMKLKIKVLCKKKLLFFSLLLLKELNFLLFKCSNVYVLQHNKMKSPLQKYTIDKITNTVCYDYVIHIIYLTILSALRMDMNEIKLHHTRKNK